MLYYRTASILPDFQRPPRGGIVSRRRDLAMGQAPIFSRWPAWNPKVLNFEWTARNATELRNLRLFLNRCRGSATPFYIPSYTNDLKSADSVSAGAESFVTTTDITGYLTGSRPDTYGRTIFVLTPGRSLSFFRILSATDNGSDWTLLLDRPFSAATDLSRCIIGFAWFARLASDDFRMIQVRPDRAILQAGIMEVRHRQDVAGTYALSETDLEGSEAFESVTEENLDPWKTDMRTATCLGPNTYSAAQAANFTNLWTATIQNDDGALEFTDGVATFDSTLWDGSAAIEHVSVAFDTLGDEAIAWQKTFDTVRLRWYDSGVASALEITGRTPLLFQNWTINGGITGGEADIVLYYLKDHESKIFARYQRDDFATEYVAVHSPVMPLALLDNYLAGTRHTIRAIATRHTRLGFLSGQYQTPLGVLADIAAADTGTLEGDYSQIAVDAEPLSEALGATTVVGGLTGDYFYNQVDSDLAESIGATTVGITGSLVDKAIRKTVGPEQVSADTDLAGTYNQTAQDAVAFDTLGANTSMTGAYEPA